MRRYVFIGLGAFVLVGIALAPATTMRRIADDIDGVTLTQTRGTLWRGSAQLLVQGHDLGALNWSFDPITLISGQIGVQWSLEDLGHTLSGTAVTGFITSGFTADGKLQPGSTNRMLQPYYMELQGQIDIQGLNVVVDKDGSIVNAEGEIRWIGGTARYRVASEPFARVLPPLVGYLSTSDGNPSITVYAIDDDVPLILASLDDTGWANVGITKQFTNIVGQPWEGPEPPQAVVLEVSEKVL